VVGTSLKLRLIHSTHPSDEPSAEGLAINKTKLVLMVAAIFFCLKLPMCFIANNPEELRDFDHYAKTAEGQYAYRDFVWIYGPVAPLVYGTALKILPANLLSVRLVTLGFWVVMATFLALLFARYFTTYRSCVVGVLLATGCAGYPGYSNNHILAALGAVICAYYYSLFIEEKDGGALLFSFAGALLSLFTRPVLMGYGVFATWSVLVLWQRHTPSRIRGWLVLMAITGGIFAGFLAIYGPAVLFAFLPRPWAVLETKSYPNLHYLVPHVNWSNGDVGMQMFKQLRVSLETGVFYLHYFIWPTLVFTLGYLLPARRNFKAAAFFTAFGLLGSLDLLHYGFSDPNKEPAMWARGQYFFPLTAAALFLVLWPAALHHTQRLKCWASRAVLLAVGVWAYLPYVIGAGQLVKFHANEYQFPALTGILTHPDRRPTFEAVAFINSKCASTDSVVIPQYTPGLDRLLKCGDLFGEDAYMFTRMPWYRLGPNETPYVPAGQITNGEAIAQRISSLNPRFYLIEGESPYAVHCTEPGWTVQIFGTGPNSRTVCWKA